MAGTADLIPAGGIQNMSQIPISSAMIVGEQFGFTTPTAESKSWLKRYGDQEISQFRGAEMIAERGTSPARTWSAMGAGQPPACLRRDPRRSIRQRGHPDRGFRHRRNTQGDNAGEDGRPVDAERGRPDDSGGGEPDLRRRQCGAAGLRAGGQRPRTQTPRPDPPLSCRGAGRADADRPIPATATRWTRPDCRSTSTSSRSTGVRPVVLAWLKETGADPERSIPTAAASLRSSAGATGAKLFATMLNELERTGGRHGLQTMCEGGGTANVTIIERL